MFTSDTDTEVIPKLAHYIYNNTEEGEDLTFVDVVERVISQLVSVIMKVNIQLRFYVFPICVFDNLQVLTIV